MRGDGASAGGLDSGPPRAQMPCMARLLIALGILLIVTGLLWGPISRLGLGRLPGDIVIERESFRLYVPVTSAILVSVVLSLVIGVIRMFTGR